ncbi:ESX secretion-associated protein EspG [Nocardia sp. NPDC047038]|uniref:ESX secretion-associated protein EspG n=1 Tax=Nocardia sp. NPDC047038 TaxID=3154338 RepID=UPI0033CD6CAB
MARTWRLTGLEYLVLRERLVGRRTSWPFAYVADVKGHFDFQFVKARVWGELQAAWDPALAEAMVKSMQADVRIAVLANDESAPHDLARQWTMAGKLFGDRAILVEGFRVRSPYSHDELVITECDAVELARVIVDKLPPMAAGGQSQVELLSSTAEPVFDHWHGRSSLYDEGDRDVDTRSRGWQAAPKSTVGRIEITHGHSNFGPSGQVTKWIFWEDHPGDGRYIVDAGPPVAAVATDAERLVRLIERECGELQRVQGDESRGGISRLSVYDDGR